MAEVKRELAMTRLLTLTGTGGSGKTRLALEVARELVGVYPDGVWLVELAPLSEPELISQEVAEALGVREQPGISLVDTLVGDLRNKKVLLILDNCEHLVDACARLVDTLLAGCPHLRVLATSREPLGVEGEIVWRVPTLSTPESDRLPAAGELSRYDAVRLFLDRARLRLPDFDLTPENGGAVAKVCGRLGGVPLAIELATARVGAITVEQISERLENSLSLLVAGPRTAAPRQRTMRATLEWSYRLLPGAERRLFGRLSAFAGGFTLEAAESVGSDSIAQADVLNLLGDLVDKSLVVAEASEDGAVRYRMLEPVRQFAREKLEESEEAEAVLRRHTMFFLAMAEEAEPELKGAQQGEWLGRLDVEHDNFRAALSWTMERGEIELGLRLSSVLATFWHLHDHHNEAQRWLEGALAEEGGSPSTRMKVLERACFLSWEQGDHERARAEYEETLALYRESDDSIGVATTLGSLGWLALAPNDFERATGLLEESLACFRALANTREIGPEMGDTLVGLGHIALSVGDYERALKLYEEALALYQESEDSVSIAMLQGSLGWLVMVQGDHERAMEIFEESLVHFREVGLPTDANVLINLALAVLGKGDRQRATELVKEGLARAREFEAKQDIAVSLQGMAVIAITQEKVERAAKLGGAAEVLREAIGNPLSVDERAVYEPYLDAARAKLGEAAWEAALAEGRAMTLEEAVEYAFLREEQSAAPTSSSTPERPSADELLALTRREEEVMVLVSRGLTNRQISTRLGISERTASNHVAKILRKLGLSSRAQLASCATERQALGPHPH
jgi:predicted ATPase/DNA-binding CsgD family transcriptional regulator/Tfp pilus assembly protein PilF